MYLIPTFPARPITRLAMSSDDNSIVRRDKPRERLICVHGSTRNQYDRKIEYLSHPRVCVCARVPVRVFRVNYYALFSGCIERYHHESRGKHRKYAHQDTRTQIFAFAYSLWLQHVYPISNGPHEMAKNDEKKTFLFCDTSII